ncbi:MAG TPA: hypothetical protein VLA90_04525 [Actinomycetota bacterium]|nr:hypothetical protein [Actinomycetota bacterium]
MKVRIHVSPGSDRVQDLLVGVGPITVMPLHPVMIETMLLPGTWSRSPDLRWQPGAAGLSVTPVERA